MGATLVVIGLSVAGTWGLQVPTRDMETCLTARDALLTESAYSQLLAYTKAKEGKLTDVELGQQAAIIARRSIGERVTAECVPQP